MSEIKVLTRKSMQDWRKSINESSFGRLCRALTISILYFPATFDNWYYMQMH